MTEERINILNKYVLAVLTILIVIMLGILIFNGNHEGTSFSFETKDASNNEMTGWKYEDKDINLPYLLAGSHMNDTAKISITLPEDLPDNYSIMYFSSYFRSRVYVDGVLIGEYGAGMEDRFETEVGNVRLIYELPEDSGGKQLDIEFDIVYHAKVVIPRIYCNTKDGLMLVTVIDNFGDILFCTIFGFVTITLIITGVVRYCRFKDKNRFYLFISFAAFVFIVALWVYSNSDFPQFYSDNNVLIAMLRHVLLICIGIPYLNVCKAFLHNGQRLLSVLKLANILLAILIILAYMSGIAALPDTLVFTHAIDLIIGLTTMILAIMEWKDYKESRALLHGLACFIIAVIIGLYLFYLYPTEKYSMFATCTGLVMFILSLFILILWQELKYHEEHMAMEIYKTMAYNDKLTGCGNRAALERLMDGFEDNERVTFIMADVNRLKRVNDSFGHDAGDGLILGAAQCMQGAVEDLKLSEYAEVFRLGGDEFVIIIRGKSFIVGNYYEALANRIDEYNKEAKHHISIARGYAETSWSRERSNFSELYRTADMMMYADKELAHIRESAE